MGQISFAGVLSLSAFLCGCTTQNAAQPAGEGESYMITADRSAFYKFGPAQAAGPDSTLVKKQRVTLLKREFGYSRVRTEDGQLGYVATEDLAPAPPEPSPPPESRLAKKSRSRLPANMTQPNDIPLPSDSPAPGFRY